MKQLDQKVKNLIECLNRMEAYENLIQMMKRELHIDACSARKRRIGKPVRHSKR